MASPYRSSRGIESIDKLLFPVNCSGGREDSDGGALRVEEQT